MISWWFNNNFRRNWFLQLTTLLLTTLSYIWKTVILLRLCLVFGVYFHYDDIYRINVFILSLTPVVSTLPYSWTLPDVFHIKSLPIKGKLQDFECEVVLMEFILWKWILHYMYWGQHGRRFEFALTGEQVLSEIKAWLSLPLREIKASDTILNFGVSLLDANTLWIFRVNSIRVESGAWICYDHPDFKGQQYILEHGEYPEFQRWNSHNDHMGSCKPIRMVNPSDRVHIL